MSRAPARDARLLEAASSDALCLARWERIDLETRRPGSASLELLLARAAELAVSPVGRDQLMSLALERCVGDVDTGAPLVNVDAPVAERSMIAKRVFGRGPHRSSETDALVVRLEEEHARRLSREARFDLLPGCLSQEAALQELLWDHPAIPASDEARLTMLCSIPKLVERVEVLSRGWPWKSLPQWFSSVFTRGAQ